MNHAIATSRRVLTFAVLDAAIREINERRFKGRFNVVAASDVWWEISHPDDENYNLALWLETKRKIELRPSIGEFGGWVMTVFQEEIAAKFGGRCLEELEDRPRDPNLAKRRTFKAYWKDCYHTRARLTKAEKERSWRTFDKVVARIPKDLREFT